VVCFVWFQLFTFSRNPQKTKGLQRKIVLTEELRAPICADFGARADLRLSALV
jgi:hypothetical protein